MKMSLAQIKRKCQIGVKLTLTAHSWGHKRLGETRAIDLVQGNAIRFEGGSWLPWPKANQIRATEQGFDVCLSENGTFQESMSYQWGD